MTKIFAISFKRIMHRLKTIRPIWILGYVITGAFWFCQIPVVQAQEDPQSVPNPTTRQRPGEDPRPTKFAPFVYESLPESPSSASEFVPVPDRWRMFYKGKWYDPYNQNVLKGDIPAFGEPGHEWFVDLSIISDTMLEHRKLPTPVGGASTNSPEATDTFGADRQWLTVENLITSIGLIRGNTSFMPPEWEFRVTTAFNYNSADIDETGALRADPGRSTDRDDQHFGFNELFVDKHLANLSDRYDFISARVGIQRFVSDFRGFIFADEAPGVRLFGNWDNNLWQYNLAWFSRLDKDTNSGINTFEARHENVVVANVYRQDVPVLGHTLQANIIHREDNAGEFGQDYDNNGFLIRPSPIGDERQKNVYNTYFGLTGDGHFDRINSTAAFYYVNGSESHNPIAKRQVDVNAFMTALELSYDIDWIRLRTSFLWASGDDDPFDSEAGGFDGIFDNPNFAGGDISFFQRQAIPLIGGGGVNLVNRNSLYPNLRPGKEEGQSNFVNPGIRLYNLGVDFELTPKLKLINNASFLQFDNTDVLEAVRQDGSIGQNIGYDLSMGFLYRPFLNNNVQIRFGASTLLVDDGVKNLYGSRDLYTLFTNFILQY